MDKKPRVAPGSATQTDRGSQTYREHTRAYKTTHKTSLRSLSQERFLDQDEENSSSTEGLTPRQQFLAEKVHLIYTYLCEHITPDQNGDPVCLYDLEFPGDCRPENCPFLRGEFYEKHR